MTQAKRRDREATTRRVVAAATTLMAEAGASAVGVNALAKAADCDKQLIYRYFGGVDGVMSALGDEVAARLSVALAAELDGAAETWTDFAAALVRGLLRAYRADPTLARLRAAEFAAPPGSASAFAAARGRAMAEWVAAARPQEPPPAGRDIPALLAIFTGAIETAVLSAMSTGAMAGLPLDDDAGWRRFEAALVSVVRPAFAPAG